VNELYLPTCRPYLAIGIVIYLTLAIIISVRSSFQRTRETQITTRDRIGQWMRTTLASLEPMLLRLGVRPTGLTLAQLGISVLAGIAYARSCVFLGGWLMLGCGVLDLLDGSMARRTGQVSRRGAFLDSVIDRYAEFFTFLGLGILFAGTWVTVVVACGFVGSMMVSYTRARAEGLGAECRGGLMQRAERYVLLGIASFLSTTLNHVLCQFTHVILIASLVLLALLTNLTALGRVRAVVAVLED
jgi:CDP-diacylglycerol---glycerol-3-phosphate 3-phosphatidyltransferase